jgi:hypothetical protein
VIRTTIIGDSCGTQVTRLFPCGASSDRSHYYGGSVSLNIVLSVQARRSLESISSSRCGSSRIAPHLLGELGDTEVHVAWNCELR